MGRSRTGRRDGTQHLLSAVELTIVPDEIAGALTPYPGDQEYEALRKNPDLFAYRQRSAARDEEVLLLPLFAESELPAGAALSRLPTGDYRRALGTLIDIRLPELLEPLGLERRRFGLERVKRSEDLIEVALNHARIPRPDALGGITKHLRTSFRLRTEYVRGRGSLLPMAIEFGVASVVERPLADIVASSIPIEGLRATRDGESGYIERVDRGSARVETEEGTAEWPLSETTLTASSEAMRRLLAGGLRSQFDAYQRSEAQVLADLLSGQAYVNLLQKAARWLSRRGEIVVARGVSFKFGNLLSFGSSDRPSAVSKQPPIEYCFSRDRTSTDQIPARGLTNYGPGDGDTFDKKEPLLLVLHPEGERATAESFIRTLREGLSSSHAFARGFVTTYRLARLDARFVGAPLSDVADPGAEYVAALKGAFDPATRPDAAIVLLRDQDADLPDDINPYVATKAWLLSQGIPSQEIRIGKATESPNNLQYILQDLCVALYAKLGGSPWTVLPSTPLAREVVLGMAYSETSERFRKRRRYMGIATVFSSDGTYILGASSPQCSYEEYPSVLADTVRDTIRRLGADQRWRAAT